MGKDYYKVLGVSKDAKDDELKKVLVQICPVSEAFPSTTRKSEQTPPIPCYLVISERSS